MIEFERNEIEKAIDKQLDIQRLFEIDDEENINLDRSSFAPKRYPRRETEQVVRRRSQKEIKQLIEWDEQ